MSASSSAVNYRHLLVVGVGLPAALALANHLVLQRLNSRELGGIPLAGLFCFYVGQTGLVSWVAATVHPWPVRWVVLVWVMLLTDLQFAILTGSEHYSEAIPCLASGVIAGQLGLFVVWGILAKSKLLWRLPALVIVAWIGWNFYQALVRVGQGPSYHFGWSDLVWMQAVVLGLLCGCLRGIGFSLAAAAEAQLESVPGSHAKQSVQFSIRDVLIGTTSLAVVLALAKAGDLLNLRFVRFLYDHGFLLVLTIATCTAAVLLVALWAALGRGNVLARIVTLAAVSLAIGAPIGWYCDAFLRRNMMTRNFPFWLYHWYLTGYWWIGWMFLAGALLAASLVIYRRLGYRLVRLPRQGFSSIPSFASSSG